MYAERLRILSDLRRYLYISGVEAPDYTVENDSRHRRTADESSSVGVSDLVEMAIMAVTIFAIVVAVCGDQPPEGLHVQPLNTVEVENELANTDLILAFVVLRHGDRTPDLDELALYKSAADYGDVFFPFGLKALTNIGKQHSYKVGEYLRRRYDDFLSRLYLPDEINVRTTAFLRTQMTALSALAALYPPGTSAQRWNPELDWQPVPYKALPFNEDDLLYYYNCPRYDYLRNITIARPEVQELVEPYKYLYNYLSKHTGKNITTPKDVHFLDNLFQTLENVGLETPEFALEVMPEIKEMTKIEYKIEFNNLEMVKLATGVMMNEIIHAMMSAMNYRDEDDNDKPKVHLVFAHENNVAAWMAASRVFEPHQPRYGSMFTLELRKILSTGQYGVVAAYSSAAGAPAKLLHMQGCEDIFCDFETFRNIIQGVTITYDEFKTECAKIY